MAQYVRRSISVSSAYEITIDSTKVQSSLTNYPVMIKLESGDITFPATSDSIYFKKDGTLLDYEVDYYDQSTEKGVFHVRIPSISSASDTTFQMYLDGTSDQSNPTGVWDSNYVFVHHMNSSLLDSTSNNNDGTNSNTTETDGLNGKARLFDGSATDYITYGNNTSLKPTSEITVQMMQTRDNLIGDLQGAFCYGQGFGNQTQKAYEIRNRTNYSQFSVSNASNTIGVDFPTTPDNSYHLYTGRVGDSILSAKLDDETAITTSWSGSIDYSLSPDLLRVGSATSSLYPMDGDVDELRISSVARSDAWVLADYYNLIDNTLVSLSAGATGLKWFRV